MTFEVGDIVKIKSKEWFDENKRYYPGFTFGERRQKFYNTTGTIDRVLLTGFLSINNSYSVWHPNMVELLSKKKLQGIIDEL